eukprot:Anaeramoba_flamelloidesc42185_g1_i1.p1 GENE.c42185_g1_i1~~c42185_g1_i1.p1  ORF type:complete len:549 (+),score=96.21 c42185_g1_i1:55-1701(+)
MNNFARVNIPVPKNEPCFNFAVGSKEASLLRKACQKMRNAAPFEIPLIINGKEYRTGQLQDQLICSDHHSPIARFHKVTTPLIQKAIEGSLKAKEDWMNLPYSDRSAIFLKAADLMSTKYKYELLASTMLGQGKNVWQAEIDVIGEACDFLRFNTYFGQSIYSRQPQINPNHIWNHVEYRPLEGYVVAITPFNFSAIGINLPTAPAIMGNTTIWKPASSAVYSNYLMYKILQEAGLPDGVIQFIPGSGRTMGTQLLDHPDFAGCHFTGSTPVFNKIWLHSAKNMMNLYKNYPRIVGETGGKNFHIYHPTCDVDSGINGMIRAAFEYQGQKCSALSRAYIPRSIWPEFKKKLLDKVSQIKVGQSDDFSVFMTAVIDKSAYKSIKKYIDDAKEDPDCELIFGGKCDSSKGWFIEPTIFVSKDPLNKMMKEEIFGPVLTLHVYEDNEFDDILKIADKTSEYALTGSIYAQDRDIIVKASKQLRYTAGNFYINCKSTGSVVGQQPFGGARASGNNQKAGSVDNLHNWVSPRSTKESFVGLTEWKYPHMEHKN